MYIKLKLSYGLGGILKTLPANGFATKENQRGEGGMVGHPVFSLRPDKRLAGYRDIFALQVGRFGGIGATAARIRQMMMVTATQDRGGYDVVEKGVVISIGGLAVVMTVGMIATMLGYERGMAHAATFIGLTTTGIGGIWVAYIIYDLYRSFSEPDQSQPETTDEEGRP